MRLAPIVNKPSHFPQTVKDISPSFVEIYNQALAAESENLDQLVGVGLRKALEFLIKDFACAENPDKEDAIKKTLLAACIEKYVNDNNVKVCAKRATWLGNDETHYVRRWSDKDIEDLKRLVKLTVNWIDNVITTQGYLEGMPDQS